MTCSALSLFLYESSIMVFPNLITSYSLDNLQPQPRGRIYYPKKNPGHCRELVSLTRQT